MKGKCTVFLFLRVPEKISPLSISLRAFLPSPMRAFLPSPILDPVPIIYYIFLYNVDYSYYFALVPADKSVYYFWGKTHLQETLRIEFHVL